MSAAPDFSVESKTILITGGTGGIGMAFAAAFAASGAKVIITDVKPVSGKLPKGVSFEALDVRSDAEAAALAKKIKKLAVLIHCAGRLIRDKEFEIDTFKDIVDIHLFGAMRLAMAFRQHLAKAKGAVIFIGSMYSYFGAPHIPAYTAAKTGLVGLTRSLAVAFAPEGVRVNAIAPGWIETEISRRGREDPVFNGTVMARLPMGRWAKPEELAGLAVFLASPAALLITGVTIAADGGYTAA